MNNEEMDKAALFCCPLKLEEIMYYLVMLVIDEIEKCNDVLDVWEAAGVRGITILESTGMARASQMLFREDLPLLPSIRHLLEEREEGHRTIFSLVEGDEMVEQLILSTEQVLGNLDMPGTGIFFAVPVARVKGLDRPSGIYQRKG
jgi:hypothetical protein